ncbi:protein Brevis radix-like 2 isoform X1 [Phragmites australis]|uniref:protein Brevis radix-like 2 isoform X1 n=1 Tax=Phragmites australis TaxID=29695 RepID=UPI002D79B469|nr:protein Brevis radix-like 2 isoform X1 [Phragmites australis]
MLACIACSTKDGGEDGSRAAAAATPHGGKSLTSQLKDMMLKFSGSGSQYKAAGSPSFRSNRFHRSSRLAAYPGIIDDSGFTSDGAAEAYTKYMRTTTSAVAARTAPSTWDLGQMAKINGGAQQHVRSPSASWIHSIGEEDDDDDEVVVLEEDRVPREWTAQVEPGVQITFVSIPGGAGNDLKRIRFNREMFNKWEAQRWWGENYDRVVELYNVQTFSRQQGFSTPSSSVDDATQRDSLYSLADSTRESPVILPPTAVGREQPIARATSCRAMAAAASTGRATCNPSTAVPDPSDHVWAHHFNLLNSAPAPAPPPFDASRATASSRDEASVSVSNASDLEATEWVEQDEPGVCITIREFGDGTRELRRVRFRHAKSIDTRHLI